MNEYEAVFAAIAEDIEVLDERTFRHQEWGRLSPAAGVELEPGELPVRPHLWRFLYLSYYSGDDRAARWLIDGAPVVLGTDRREDREVAALLAAANRATGYRDPGWRAVGRNAYGSLVRKDGVTLTVVDEQVVPPCPEAGADVEVVLPSGRPYLYPGWYLAISEHGMPRHGERRVVRLYWTPHDPASAARLLRSLTGRLGEVGVPFQVKAANNPDGYARRDPLVFYLYRDDWEQHRGLLTEVHRAHAAELRDVGPCFARELGRGWWLADEPDKVDGRLMSFGQHRCLLVAEGLVNAWQAGATSAEQRLTAVLDRFWAMGIDPAHPYLNAAPVEAV